MKQTLKKSLAFLLAAMLLLSSLILPAAAGDAAAAELPVDKDVTGSTVTMAGFNKGNNIRKKTPK